MIMEVFTSLIIRMQSRLMPHASRLTPHVASQLYGDPMATRINAAYCGDLIMSTIEYNI